MRTALGATSASAIDSEMRERPSSAPVDVVSNVLKIANGASSRNQTARPGLSSACAIGSASMKPASAMSAALAALSTAE